MKRILRGIEAEARASATRDVRVSQRAATTRVTNVQREEQKLARWRQSMRNRHFQQEERDRKRSEKAAESAAAKQAALATKTARHQQREEERITRWRQNIRTRHFQQAQREEERAVTRAQRMRERTAGRIMTGAGRVANAGKAALAGGALMATAAMGNAVLDRAGFDSQVRKVANAGFDAEKHGTREQLAARIKSTTAGINQTSGMDESEVLRGLSSGIGISGDIDGMLSSLADLEKVASGTGADMGDIGETFGTLLKSFEGMPDAAERAKDMLYTLAGQGDLGSVELKDMATQGSKLSGSVVGMSGDKTHNLRTMSALMQLSRVSGATSAEEAGTSITALKSDLTRSASSLKKQGINVFDENGQMNDLRGTLAEVVAKFGKDPTAMNKIFQEQSRKSVTGLVDISQQAGGGQAGKDAIAAFFKEKDAQTVSRGAMDERAAFVAGGADRQWGKAMGEFNREVGDKLLPELSKLIPELARLTPYVTELAGAMADAVGWLAENPFEGAGILIAGYIGKEIAAAKIGDLIRTAIEGGGGPLPGGAVGTAAAGGAKGGWKSLAMTGVIGTALAGAMDMGTGFYNAEDKSEFLADKFSFSKGAVDTAKLLGLGALPGIGSLVNAMDMSNTAARAVDMDAAKQAQGGGLGEMFSSLSEKLDELLGKNDKVVEAQVAAARDMSGAARTLQTLQNRTTPMSKDGSK